MTARTVAPAPREYRITSAAANERLAQRRGSAVTPPPPPAPRPDQVPATKPTPGPWEQLYRALVDKLFAVVRKYSGLADDVADAIRPFHPQLQAHAMEVQSWSK